MRSVPLRGFDQEMAAHIVTDLEREGVVFVRGAELLRVEAPEEGGRKVASWTAPRRAAEDGAVAVPATEASDAFDTVLLAVGRDAYTQKLGLDKAGVTRNAANGKLPVPNPNPNTNSNPDPNPDPNQASCPCGTSRPTSSTSMPSATSSTGTRSSHLHSSPSSRQ